MPPFDADVEIGVNIAHMTRLSDVFLVATGKTDKKKKRALLLYQADPKVK